MKQTLFFILLSVFLLNSCKPKNERIENRLMKCKYLSFQDNGKQLKELLSDYESHLIKTGVLLDITGKSYKNTINKIANGIEIKNKPPYSFIKMLNGIEKSTNSKSNDCLQSIDSSKYDVITFNKLQKTMKSIINTSNNLKAELLANGISEVLSEKDFEFDFYKMRAFFLFDMLMSKSNLSTTSPDENKNYNLDKALKIYINDKNKIFINKLEVNLKDLAPTIIKYFKDNKSNSIISIKTEKESKYSDFIAVKNEITNIINSLREQLSQEKFKKNYNDLTEQQQNKINQEFPNSIITP